MVKLTPIPNTEKSIKIKGLQSYTQQRSSTAAQQHSSTAAQLITLQ
jgi:hypothetical protein